MTFRGSFALVVVFSTVISVSSASAQWRQKPKSTAESYQHYTPLNLKGPESSVIPGAQVQRDQASGQVRRLRGSFPVAGARNAFEASNSFLSQHAGSFSLDNNLGSIRPLRQTLSQSGTRVTYQQYYGGLPVLGGELSVHVDRRGNVELVNNDVAALPSQGQLAPMGDSNRAIQIASANLSRARIKYRPRAQAVAFFDGRHAPVSAWNVSVVTMNPPGDWEVVVDAVRGVILSSRNRSFFADGKGMVFNPDPVTTSGNFALTDPNGGDTPELTAQLVPVTLSGLDGSGMLTGQFATTAPTTKQARAHEPTLNFHYTRSDVRFDEVMSYYHMDFMQHYIQSLGFNNINNRSVGINVNGEDDDNSHYDPSTKEITFGTGGVHDAQDAEIIYHEAGHSIQDNQVPGWGSTEEGGAMGEGFGDYWAGSAFAKGNKWDVFVGKWDAVAYNPASGGNPAFLRRLDSPKHYPEGKTGEVHDDGEIWSATLWKVRMIVGRQRADRIILESHFHLSPTAVFQDGARAILQANQSLYAGADQAAINQVFVDRGILPR